MIHLETSAVISCFSLFEGYEYYLSDSSGLPITTDGKIVVHKRDGTYETHIWTLKNWLNVSGIRYQSTAKLYCVQKLQNMATTNFRKVEAMSLLCATAVMKPFFRCQPNHECLGMVSSTYQLQSLVVISSEPQVLRSW